MVIREITVSELLFLRSTLESFLEKDVDVDDVELAVELVDKLINYREPDDDSEL